MAEIGAGRATALDPKLLADGSRIPYRGDQPREMRPDLIVDDVVPADERLWVPLADGVCSRPLQFNVTQGYYVHLLRATRSGVIARHRHSGPVHAYVLKGRWCYLEHDWIAEEGSYVFEPPGETHTLIVPEGTPEMITLFHVTGTLVYVDPDGQAVGYDDVFARIEIARAHYERIGLGEDYIATFIR
jgi:2,4'-dihydroxyacetophenone dioxygenase